MNKIILTVCIIAIVAIIIIAIGFATKSNNQGKVIESNSLGVNSPNNPDNNKPIVNKPLPDNNTNTTKPTNPTPDTNTNVPTTPVTPTPTGYTMADVAKHNTQTDCWQVINNKIYNLTNFSDSHSGGAKVIIQGCGTDASAEFNAKHGSRETKIMQPFYVGALN